MWRRIVAFFRSLRRPKGEARPPAVIEDKPRGGAPTTAPAAPRQPGPRDETPDTYARTRAASYVDLVIGLDLGTSSTKAAVQAPYFRGGRRVTMVEWDRAAQGLKRFLLPTRIQVGSAGELRLEPFPGCREVADLKLQLMAGFAAGLRASSEVRPGEADGLVTGYLALALRHIWQWFEEVELPLHQGATPRWQVNIGIPSAGYDDSAMQQRYERMLKAAWWVAGRPEPVTTVLCAEALARASAPSFEPGLPRDAFSVVPEIAAEVVGYAKSVLRATGLHVLIDVGASTLDICGFVLHERDGDDRYAFLTSDVQQLGVYRLHLNRLDKLRSSRLGEGGVLTDLCRATAMDPIPMSIRNYLERPSHAASEAPLDRVDRDFGDACRRVVVRTVRDLYKSRDPHSPRWRDGLPIFLAGGGSRHPIYRQAIDAAHASMVEGMNIGPFDLKSLPRPSPLATRGIQDSDFLFLPVAFGLSHERIVIGEIQPPSKIEDVCRVVRPREGNAYIDKDQV